MASRNDDRVAEGKAVKIMGVKPAGFSLYSCVNDLSFLSHTIAHARLAQTKNKEAQKFLDKVSALFVGVFRSALWGCHGGAHWRPAFGI